VIPADKMLLWSAAMRFPNELDAAKHLGIGSTQLKRMCQRQRMLWPGRKIRAMYQLIHSPYVSTDDVHKVKFILRSAPWHEFKHGENDLLWIKKVQRAVYKKSYSARQQAKKGRV
jgi:hypothetical protein